MAVQKLAPHLISDTEILNGKPIIARTRISVYIILGKFAAGMTLQEFEEEYDLELLQVKDAMQFAAHRLEHVDAQRVS